MVLKVYGFPTATCTRRVAAVLREKKVPFELITIALQTGEHKSPEYLEKQPFGKIPYIDDDGFILYESRAIVRYIATKYASQGTQLLPTDLQGLARLEQAINVEAFNFEPPIGAAIMEKYFNELQGLPVNEAALAIHLSKAEEVIKIYDQILAKQKYVAGDQLTIADFYHTSSAALLAAAGSDAIVSGKYPNVARWWKELSSRESWAAVKDTVASVESY